MSLREVYVAGTGMVRFGKFPDKSIEELARPAILEVIKDSGLDRRDIQAVYSGNVYNGSAVGQRVVKLFGLTGIPIYNLENVCSSSATAFHNAWLGIASGVYDAALVVGVESMSRLGRGPVRLPDDDIEVQQGFTMPGLYAMRAQRHMANFGTTIEQLALVSVKNHKNGALNPLAHYQEILTLQEVLQSRPIADPLTLYHSCPVSDGAAATILVSQELLRKTNYASKPVRVRGSVLVSGLFETGPRDMATDEITVRAARQIWESTGIGPEDVNVAEVHDAFTIAEIMYYEALGFCDPGEGGRLVESGDTEITGRIPVNPSGGLISRGHPVGATGVAQIVEITRQLRHQCGAHQVDNPLIGLTHCTGGGISGLEHAACTIHLFSKN